MGDAVRRYEVTEQCYVPVGTGFKFKRPGQIVHLDADDAKKLADFVSPVRESVRGIQKLNTPKPIIEESHPVDTVAGVNSNAGEPGPVDERIDAENRE